MKTHQSCCTIETCRGVRGECPNALPLPDDLTRRLEDALEQDPWLSRLRRSTGPYLRPHQRLRVAVCACANGCSRPQIADLGLLAAERPQPPETCSGCGACVTACPDGLVSLRDTGQGPAPVIETETCLNCGLCARACPTPGMGRGPVGLRVQVGGKLGRRPLLGAELPGIHDLDAALDILRCCLEALGKRNPGPDQPMVFRLAELRRERGLDWLDATTKPSPQVRS